MSKGKAEFRLSKNDEGDTIQVTYANRDIDYTIESLDIDPKDIDHHNSKYPVEKKIQAVMYYLLLKGNAYAVAKKINVPAMTIRKWKSSAPWWDNVMAKCRAIKQDELDAIFTCVIHDVMDQIEDRVLEGDYRLDKNGDTQRVPMTGRDLGQLLGTVFSTRSLIRGDPTAIRKQTTATDQLKAIESRILKTVNDAKAINVVSDQPQES